MMRGMASHDMTGPQPLNPTPTPEVLLPRSPLVRVLAQVRFPTILAIRDPDSVVGFQNALRETYPNLHQDQVHNGEALDPHPSPIWRLTDREMAPDWRVSLGESFVAIETSSYDSRKDFLDRLLAILSALGESFQPASASRLGLRHIDRLTGKAVDQIGKLVHTEVLGIMQPTGTLNPLLRDSVVHQLNEAQFLSSGGARVQSRWGWLPAKKTYDPTLDPIENPSWVLDLDMFTTESQPFSIGELLKTATDFAECLYWVFRQMVTEEFLRFYGGEPC